MADIIILGDSHIHAIQAAHLAHGEGPIAGRTAFISRYTKLKPEAGLVVPGVTPEQAKERTSDLGPDDLVVSVIGGNEFNIFGMVQHPVPFDYFEPDMPGPLLPDTQIIPSRTIDELFASTMLEISESRIRALREASRAPMVQLAPPPPKQDGAFVLERADEAFKARNVGELGVSPAPLRLKLWYTQLRLLRRSCRAMGIELLPPPAAVLTPDGYLDRHFYAKDATHANAHYGTRILRQLSKYARTPEHVA